MRISQTTNCQNVDTLLRHRPAREASKRDEGGAMSCSIANLADRTARSPTASLQPTNS